MASTASRFVARLLWVLPGILLFLTVNQAKVAVDIRTTWEKGTPAIAEVFAYENSDRADVTFGYVSLRVPLGDGEVLTKDRLSLPKTLLPRLEGQASLDVRVRPGTAQEVVIAKLMPAHWLIAASQSGMGLIGALLFGAGVFWWNRYLRRPRKEPDAAT
ncbi:MAG: DUF3592 domain-containing protein [Rhodothermales bacterium]